MSTMRRLFRAGDRVYHAPSGEKWILGTDEEDGRVMPAGWPETLAEAKHCTLTEAATDDERMQMLLDFADSREVDIRTLTARRQLFAMGATS